MFCQEIKQLKEEEKTIVYIDENRWMKIDESGFADDMPRTHGYAKMWVGCYWMDDWGSQGNDKCNE